jgi:hypothetical protein
VAAWKTDFEQFWIEVAIALGLLRPVPVRVRVRR